MELTEAEKKLTALRESGYKGWINQDGNAVSSFTHPVTGEEIKLPPHGFDCKCHECR